ncbi:methyltransferase domain-containing protein [Streptomyces chrestomyceticus]|uniref:methyltransferase domain-containing protein n=1 Tax=Streptomyces chrestomyceticus TaxID=68185 RepID=UPI0019D06B50|nr:methyltransferase domain-containing protein [Streptomyces chrestomyceticus]
MSTEPGLGQEAARLRAKLVRTLTDAGDLTDPAWRAAFEAVPRHACVPCFYDHAGRTVAADDPETRDQWLTAVHENRQLVTHRTAGSATSSSSMPSLMATMLEALQAADGMRVLEVGTGTGYNAALLAHRLGDDNVVTIDVSPDITGLARERLAAIGHQPLVVTGDGALGWPDKAPYDRIIVTCRLRAVPPALLRQLTEAGFILAPLGNALARIHRTGERTAEGAFLPGGAFFMPLRRGADDGQPTRRPGLPDTAGRPARLPAALIADNDFRFLVSIAVPGLTWQYDLDEERKPTGARVWAPDGSLADLKADGTVTEAGPRNLWSLLEAAYDTFLGAGRPGPERYGVTIDADAQRVWLDSPRGPGWNLTH